jgi:glycosyltransferase involved in cell wall biosynthesis
VTEQIELSIVIPAYNEEDRIVPTLRHTLAYLETRPYRSQVLVVSDGSSDGTIAVVKNMPTNPKVRLDALEYHPNRGKGYAVQYGMLQGLGRICMFMDADYAVPIEYCEQGMALIASGHDIAIASRAMDGSDVKLHQNLARHMSAKIYTLIQNRYLHMDFPDTQCGFKLFTRAAAKNLFSRQKLNSVIFDPEILWLAQKAKYAIAQFPVQWTHIEGSRIQYDNLKKSIYVFQELLRIKGLHKK